MRHKDAHPKDPCNELAVITQKKLDSPGRPVFPCHASGAWELENSLVQQEGGKIADPES